MRCGAPISTVVHQRMVAFRTGPTKRAYFGGQGMGQRKLPFLSRGTYQEEVSPAGEVFYSGMSGNACWTTRPIPGVSQCHPTYKERLTIQQWRLQQRPLRDWRMMSYNGWCPSYKARSRTADGRHVVLPVVLAAHATQVIIVSVAICTYPKRVKANDTCFHLSNYCYIEPRFPL